MALYLVLAMCLFLLCDYGCVMFDSVDVFGYGTMSDNYFI